jgi:hypothetical protein
MVILADLFPPFGGRVVVIVQLDVGHYFVILDHQGLNAPYRAVAREAMIANNPTMSLPVMLSFQVSMAIRRLLSSGLWAQPSDFTLAFYFVVYSVEPLIKLFPEVLR